MTTVEPHTLNMDTSDIGNKTLSRAATRYSHYTNYRVVLILDRNTSICVCLHMLKFESVLFLCYNITDLVRE